MFRNLYFSTTLSRTVSVDHKLSSPSQPPQHQKTCLNILLEKSYFISWKFLKLYTLFPVQWNKQLPKLSRTSHTIHFSITAKQLLLLLKRFNTRQDILTVGYPIYFDFITVKIQWIPFNFGPIQLNQGSIKVIEGNFCFDNIREHTFNRKETLNLKLNKLHNHSPT